jgi:hypothetical protein
VIESFVPLKLYEQSIVEALLISWDNTSVTNILKLLVPEIIRHTSHTQFGAQILLAEAW